MEVEQNGWISWNTECQKTQPCRICTKYFPPLHLHITPVIIHLRAFDLFFQAFDLVPDHAGIDPEPFGGGDSVPKSVSVK
jgi:hypothetical protein